MKNHVRKTRLFVALAGVFSMLVLACPAQNLLTNGDFENEPNWGNAQVYYDGNATAMIGSEIPGWTIEPNHAATIQTTAAPYYYLTISGTYSLNTDGEGYMSNSADLYQDFSSQLGTPYVLTFNWQNWSTTTPTNSQLDVTVVDDLTSAVLFEGLYSYDPGSHPVHTVSTNFLGTGNSLRLRIQESPESGYNDDMFVVDNFSVTVATNVGALLVNIAPPDAVSAGAEWQVDDGPYQASGAVVTNLSLGNHAVAFNNVPGWITPATQIVAIAFATTNTIAAVYQSGPGILQVAINPPAVVSVGAEWQVDGGAFQTNGAVVSNLPVGNHAVSFSTVPGWVTPANQTVAVSGTGTNTVSGTYSALSPSQFTYIWAHNALGQEFQHCNNLYPQYWPSNSSWTQTYTLGSGCPQNRTVETGPANWDPADSNTPSLDTAAYAGLYPGGPGLEGVNVILGSATAEARTYASPVHLVLNNMTMQAPSSLGFGYDVTLNRIEFQGDGTINGGGINISNGGTMLKSAGAGTYFVNGYINATNDLFEVDSGTLAFPSGYGNANLTGNSIIAVSNNATLLLTVDNGAQPFFSGTITGVGGGTVLLNKGAFGSEGGNLNFPGNMFQWTGGKLQGGYIGGPCTNSGIMNLTNAPGINGETLYNNNLINLADNSALAFDGNGGSKLYNNAGGTFDILGNSSLLSGGAVYNYGLFIKSAGTGSSQVLPGFNNYGGTIEADTGTLALNVNGAGFFTNATFVVSNGATIDFLTNNYNLEIEGNLTGSGGGTILMKNGSVYCNYGASLDFPGAMFQWQGGKLGNGSGFVVTNLGTLNVSGPVGIDGYLQNSGMMIQSGTGVIGSGYGLYNDVGAVYDIQNDNGLSLNPIYNYGLFKKSAGTGTSSLTVCSFNNYGPNATLEVDSGTLEITGTCGNGSGTYFTNSSVIVSNGASLILNSQMDFEGTITGTGGGSVVVTNALIVSGSYALLNFPGSMFQLAGGHLGNQSLVMTNLGTINVSGSAALNGYDPIANNGTMIQSGTGSISSGVGLNNNPGAVYDIQNDHGVTLNTINNYGLIKKSAGNGMTIIQANIYNYGPLATLEADSGVLALYNDGANYFTNSTLVVSNGATLDLNLVNNSTEIEGYFNGSGNGTVLMTNGTILCASGAIMNFPGAMFQWLQGSIGNTVQSTFLLTNAGTFNIGGPVSVNGYLANNGTMIQSGAGSMGSGNLKNTGVYDIQDDNGTTLNNFSNYGLIKKSAGTDTSQIYSINSFYDNGGALEVDSGTLALANGGYYFTNTPTFMVSNGATLALKMTDNNTEIEGSWSGSGGGTVTMTNGTTINSRSGATLNFPGAMFQWLGGLIGNSASGNFLLTNAGVLNISGPVAVNSFLINSGTMTQSGAGAMGSGTLANTGVYDLQNDHGTTLNNFNNYGLIKKSAGAGTSQIYSINSFYNAGTLEVDSGTLALANSGYFFTNSLVVVSNGATLALKMTDNNEEVEGTITGSGGGTVTMTNGTEIYTRKAAILNFPGSMFQWQGGLIGNTATSSPLLTNAGTLNIVGLVSLNGYLANDGTMIQSGPGALKSGGAGFKNDGLYQIQNDCGVTNGYFVNNGLLEKNAGGGTSTIYGSFYNYGSIQVPSGTIQFNGGEFDQYTNTLQITRSIAFGSGQEFHLNGGRVIGVGMMGYTGGNPVRLNGGVLAPGNPFGTINIPADTTYVNSGATINIVLGGANQFSELACKGYLQLGGKLNVTLTNGYTPAIGTQFQIITNGSLGNSFASVNVPQGISLTYSNAGVYLTVTGAVPPQVVSPQVSSGTFGFTFGTVNGQSYTVQQNTDLAAPNWTFYTNIIGNGLLYQLILPVRGLPGIYFRVSEP